ncbi:RNA polymerase sigma-70 factor, ECF subfamily [Pedobacter steynii]|uniref:RNA polymerase sigma-70 factor, ECF subfamily n=1 Tax=Pedobacter steynii TaxID=430522 RepID=A0A1H0AEM0_9SPHI|nr:RNA polymerase sigma-70 factor [Pedobacter steynii]NQX41394.1 RNA polymerase sigma-70 factor [Pedobacter steynii]SDN31463.1 RNA polymerase sigma-70 factor, ECF subfamily [Pedobacter steynii]
MTAHHPLSDDELFRLFESGERSCYDQIFKRFYNSLCYFAQNILGDINKAEDVAQDALIALWHHHQSFKTLQNLRSFLYVCVRNSCFNELEKMKVRTKYQDSLIHGGVQSDATVLESIIQAEVVRKLFFAVDALPEQCRKVISMTFRENKTPKEIAEKLNVSISTVNNQKMRGLLLLRRQLSNEDLNIAILCLGLTLAQF